MSQSIVNNDKHCYRCGAVSGLHRHHIYGAGNRTISEREGFWVWLCHIHHTDHQFGVHHGREFDLELKKKCQELYELKHSRDEFMRLIGRNYRDD